MIKGIMAKVHNGQRGSYYEAFRNDGDVYPVFRLTDFPEMGLEMGDGTNDTDTVMRRLIGEGGWEFLIQSNAYLIVQTNENSSVVVPNGQLTVLDNPIAISSSREVGVNVGRTDLPRSPLWQWSRQINKNGTNYYRGIYFDNTSTNEFLVFELSEFGDLTLSNKLISSSHTLPGTNGAPEQVLIARATGVDRWEYSFANTEGDSGNSGAADTIDFSDRANQKSTLTASTTYTFTDPLHPRQIILHVVQDAVGGYTITWPVNIVGTPAVPNAGALAHTIYEIYFDGTDYHFP